MHFELLSFMRSDEFSSLSVSITTVPVDLSDRSAHISLITPPTTAVPTITTSVPTPTTTVPTPTTTVPTNTTMAPTTAASGSDGPHGETFSSCICALISNECCNPGGESSLDGIWGQDSSVQLQWNHPSAALRSQIGLNDLGFLGQVLSGWSSSSVFSSQLTGRRLCAACVTCTFVCSVSVLNSSRG